LDQECQEVDAQQCSDASDVLQLDRSNLELRLDLRESLFDHCLLLVGHQYFTLVQVRLVRDQRKCAVRERFLPDSFLPDLALAFSTIRAS